MRPPRITGETSRFFPADTSGPQRITRRVTRSSVKHLPSEHPPPAAADDLTLGSDIEDAIQRKARKRRRVTKEEDAAAASSVKLEPASPPAPRQARKPARKVKDPETGVVKAEPPTSWLETYNAVLGMRRPGGIAAGAAVDTMGCERLADRSASDRDRRFQTLVALMLSSQTKDTVNAAAMARLKEELPAWKEGEPVGLNLENMLAVEPEVLNGFIRTVGFHNNKTKYIKQAAVILRDKFGGDIPPTIDGLTSLPGVGPKMAHLCLSAAWGRTEGIGVDVHVHRITNLWGWHKTRTPEETRLALQAWLPREKWHEINWLLVGFGQTICPSSARRCGECEVGLAGLCRAADRGKVMEGRKRRGAEKVEAKVEAKIKVEEGVVEGEEEKGVATDLVKKEEAD
ncbi:related to DNA repair protein NTG1 [Cephalotrichum gorgonifer]|uniref:Endonuclease III homolog n=1 Tax=Cephalotrichum gorgonifer TaxID=2041049 RepID=A0AAE8MQM3_9PEZI|nr:related to DNA repair protein NTG1 [Cephalotrichum gorgonifer]